MKEIVYKIKDPLGIHARPAGLLVKEASKYNSDIALKVGEKQVDGKKLFSVMGLNAKHEDILTVTITGTDEAIAYDGMKKFLEENL